MKPLLYLAIGLAVLTAHAASLTPQPVLNSKGLAALTFVETGSRAWVNNFGGGSPSGYFTAWDGHSGPTSAILTDSTLDQTYPWGIAHVTFTVSSDKTLRIHGSVTNQSTAAVTLDLTLCKIDFPRDATTDIKRTCTLEPGLITFDASTPEIPCWFSLSDFGGWPGEITVGQENWSNNAQYAKKLALAAGAKADFDFHLNFVTAESDLGAVKTAVNQAFAHTYPQEHWTTDLRSIGQIFFVTGEGASGWHKDHAKWAKNPRGWLGDPALDISNKAAFKARMEDFCHVCVQNADGIQNIRGFVIWDVEGEQYEHGPCVYVGHPTQMPTLAPEMNEIIDDLLTILEDGGKYEVGFCLRQQQVARKDDPNQPYWLRHWDNSDGPQAQEDLRREIDYCVTRWGGVADLYYVDSNDGNEVDTYKNLRAAYPYFLIYPESFTVVSRMYAYEPQYQTGRPQDYVRNGLSTQQKYIDIYPNAQSVINLADVANNPANLDATTKAMLRGDIQQVRIWWSGGSEYPLLQAATAQAQALGWPHRTAPSPTPSASPSPTASPQPVETYRAWYDDLARWLLAHPPTPDK